MSLQAFELEAAYNNEHLKNATDKRRPVDEKILGGLAVCGEIVPETLELIQQRLESVLSEVASGDKLEPNKEHGSCLLYGVNLSEESQAKIESSLAEEINQKAGSVSRNGNLKNGSGILLVGVHGSRPFYLRKHNGPVFLDDGSAEPATVYNLSFFHQIQ